VLFVGIASLEIILTVAFSRNDSIHKRLFAKRKVMEDYLTTENHERLIERKSRIAEARDVLEHLGPKIKDDEAGA